MKAELGFPEIFICEHLWNKTHSTIVQLQIKKHKRDALLSHKVDKVMLKAQFILGGVTPLANYVHSMFLPIRHCFFFAKSSLNVLLSIMSPHIFYVIVSVVGLADALSPFWSL